MAPGPTRSPRARRTPARRAGWVAAILPAAAVLLAAACGQSATGPAARTAQPDPAGDRIGTLALHGPQGLRACTASVVNSPQGNLLVTAAHCVQTRRLGLVDGLVFTPGYRNGEAPHGSWRVQKITVDPRWTSTEDPEYDVAFVTVGQLDGQEVEEVVGGNELGTGQGFGLDVAVTGYPNDGQEPITCSGRTSSQSPTQERFDCGGYTNGTSGSPWVTADGVVVGVIGGYQEGGDTPQTSYSITFDDRVTELYHRAITS
ncbi:trypsin-like serine peptidase [Kitasatospora sp. NPDC050543]|uniref:trypsin-like serine peptidase n=1 Tax=Kitasatospora sp. NPDC050543 TaxID=3364054 RepID=UPI00378C8736